MDTSQPSCTTSHPVEENERAFVSLAREASQSTTPTTLSPTFPELPTTPVPAITKPSSRQKQHFYVTWLAALKSVLPVYTAVHIVFALLTLFAPLFLLNDFSSKNLRVATIWQSWNRWDTGHYTTIATKGYDGAWRTAFFPLFPFLEHIGAFITHNPFIAGLIISAIANLILLIVLYQLVKDDFGHEQAYKTVLYLSIFPSAFFFASAYTESVFLCFLLLSFYSLRKGQWVVAGLFGFFACLTRSAGIFLLLPFCVEYMRQHEWRWQKIRWSVVSIALVPAGLASYSLYCYRRFHDALSWSHAQTVWSHQFLFPWDTLLTTLRSIKNGPGVLSFPSLHNLLDLSSILGVIALLILLFVGPQRLRKEHIAYTIYAVFLGLFLLCFPVMGDHPIPLQSVPRYMLEVFPIFIVAAAIGNTYRWFHSGYVLIASSLLAISCLLFLTGHWMI